MVEGWSTEEAIEFCTNYLDIKRVGVLKSHHEGRLRDKGTIGEKSVIVDDPISFRQAQFAVLQQAEGVMPYIDEHRQSLQTLYPSRSQAWLDKKHKEEFVSWLQRRLLRTKLGNQLDALAKDLRIHILSTKGMRSMIHILHKKARWKEYIPKLWCSF